MRTAIHMDLVAGRASHLISGVAALQPARVRRLIQMASQADLVGRYRRQLRRISYVIGRRRLRVLLRRAVAGFASLAREAALLVRLYLLVRRLCERFGDVFMTCRARLGSCKTGFILRQAHSSQ
jgi:hypothetical protein